jgi:hypothetical protein
MIGQANLNLNPSPTRRSDHTLNASAPAQIPKRMALTSPPERAAATIWTDLAARL